MVADDEPHQGVGPHHRRPLPAERGHEHPVDGDDGGDGLSAEDGDQQDAGGADGPERPTRSGQEDREMSGDGQHEVHQGLHAGVSEVEDAVAQVEKTEGSDRSKYAQHGGDPEHQSHVPGFGSVSVVDLVVRDRQDGAVVEQRKHHDHDGGQRVEIENEDGEGDEQQHPQGFGDAVDRVAVHPLKDLAALFDRVDDDRQPRGQQHDVGGRAGGVGGSGDGDAAVGLLQRGGVVDPVAGHPDDVVELLQDIDDVILVLGEDLGETISFLNRFC